MANVTTDSVQAFRAWRPRGGRESYPVKLSSSTPANVFAWVDNTTGLVDATVSDLAKFKFLGITLTSATSGAAAPHAEVRVNTEGVTLRGVAVAGSTVAGVLVFCTTNNPADMTVTAATNMKAVGIIVRRASASDNDVRLFTPAEYLAL